MVNAEKGILKEEVKKAIDDVLKSFNPVLKCERVHSNRSVENEEGMNGGSEGVPSAASNVRIDEGEDGDPNAR